MERETGFEPATLALARRLNTLCVAHCFSIIIYLHGLYDVLLCSLFLNFAFLLQQICNASNHGTK